MHRILDSSVKDEAALIALVRPFSSQEYLQVYFSRLPCPGDGLQQE